MTAILRVLEDVDGMSTAQLEKTLNLRRGQIEKVLKFLSAELPAPVIKSGSIWHRTPVAYQMNHAQIQRLIDQRRIEWNEVQDYIGEQGCLMEFLAKALDDADPRPCGKCASCLRAPIVSPSIAPERAIEATRFLRQSEFPLECKKRVVPDAFSAYGFRGNLPVELRAETGRVLSRWGDAGLGAWVAKDKHDGHFRDEFVDIAVEMLKYRWQPVPAPGWITCVPSRKRPMLVPDYARRLAEALGLPFMPVVTKIKDNEPQKDQQNGFHQCRNLDGAFTVSGQVPNGPVLLLDDVVDSGWTLTVVAALVLRAGSGPVWPLALATANIGA